MSQKSYNGTATLYVIPTPIGNLDDITLRAINTLKEVEAVFAEDTRVTAQLLNHLNISKKIFSNYKYNEKKNEAKLLEYLSNNQSVAVVSDRGTPGISDPGFELVKIALKHNFNVVSLPGATAFVPALTMSGIETDHFLFYGFLDSKSGKRKTELEKLKNLNFTLILYEAPHRIKDMLLDVLEVMGNRNICVAREISKKYEEVYRGKVNEVLNEIEDIKGEIVVIVEGCEAIDYNEISIVEHVNSYIKEGFSVMDSIKKVAHDRKLNKNEVYKEYHS